MEMKDIEGRYPRHPKALRGENIRAAVYATDEGLFVRMDDRDNPEFWLEFVITGVREDTQDVMKGE